MLKKLALATTMCVLFFFNKIFAQHVHKITGRVIDSTSTPVSDANIVLILDSDTLKTSSDKDGWFFFNVKKTGNFNLNISHINFAQFNSKFFLSSDSEEISLGVIELRVNLKQLKEVLIKYTRKPIILKKDTIEYDVDYFKKNDDELIEYLIKRMPGLNLSSDGDLTVDGKKVLRLRVNGQDFFSGNIKEFIKKLPTGIFSKLQIINDFGADAAFSGIKNKPGEKILNLVTKPGMDNGIFGNIYSSIGTNKLVSANLTGNYWKEIKQIAVNVNLQNATNAVGSNISNKVDLSYSDLIGKNLKLGLNYNFNNFRKSQKNSTFSEAVNLLGKLNKQTDSETFLKSNAPTFGLNVSYEPNRMTSIKIAGNYFQNNSKDSTFLNSQQTGIINQGLISGNSDNNKSSTGDFDLGIGRKLDKTGRVITANFQYRTNNTNFTNTTYRKIRYNDTLGNFIKDSVFNSLTIKKLKLSNTNVTLSYTQPLNSNSNLDIIYNFSSSLQNTVLTTEEILSPLKLIKIDSLSSQYKNLMSNHKLEINYRFEKDKITIVSGLNLQRTALSGNYSNNVRKVEQSINNLSPKLNLTYNPSNAVSLDLNYLTEIEAPTIDELQPVQDIKDLQNIYVGNPNLKPALTHEIELNFRHISSKANKLFNAGLSTSFIQNRIVPNTTIIVDTLNSLKQLTRFVNTNGSYRIGGHYGYSLPIKLFKVTLNTSYNGSVDLNNDVVYTDNIKTKNRSQSIVQNIKTLISQKHLNSELMINYTGVSNNYNVGQGLKRYVSTLTFSLNENVAFNNNTSLTINATKSFNSGYTNIGSNNPFVVNATFSRSFFKQSLQANLLASDIFNQASNINQTRVANSIVYNRTNYISRFFILSLSYRISKFGHFK